MTALTYTVDRANGTVTVFNGHPALILASGVTLDESDLIAMLSDLQTGDATLAELAGLT